MQFAKRIEKLPAYLFAEISKKIAEKRAQGVDVISFGIGDPDLATPDHLLDALQTASRDPANHRYPESEGLPELRQSIARWYQKRFGVEVDPDKEILPLIGSKEGIGHIAFCFIDPGDVALVPDPGYPVYAVGTLLAGGEPYFLPLTEENEFLPDLDSIPEEIARKAKLLWLNYPNNPQAPSLTSNSSRGRSPSQSITGLPCCTTVPTRRSRSTGTGRSASCRPRARKTWGSSSIRCRSRTT
jgi:LL-diaminopimelate aminotransferase